MLSTKPERMLAMMIGVMALAALAVPVPSAAARAANVGTALGPERPVSQPVPGSPRYSSGAEVEYGGGVFLTVWTDDYGHLWASRVDRLGAAVDPSGIRVAADNVQGPDVAFDGENFLVIWANGSRVYGRRVSPGGVLLDDRPIDLGSIPGAQNPRVSFGGGSYLVVWTRWPEECCEGGDIFGRRVSPEGEVLDASETLIAAPPGSQYDVNIAFNGRHHLLVWDSGGDSGTGNISGTLVTTAGVALGPGRTISSTPDEDLRPELTAVGASFFVVWEHGSWPVVAVSGSRVGADGAVLDDPAIPIMTGSAIGPLPGVSSDGTNALVAWVAGADDGSGSQVRGTRIDPSGTVLDPTGVELTSRGSGSRLAYGDGNYFLMYGTDITIEGTRVTRRLAVLDPHGIEVAIGANSQDEIDLVFDGANHFVVWADGRSGRAALYGGRVGPDGELLDGAGFRISSDADVNMWSPSVAFDGTNFLVVWVGGAWPDQVIRAARVNRSGEILDRFDIPSGANVTSPSVAFGNGVFLVGWDQEGGRVAGSRVTTDGVVLDPGGFPISRDPEQTFATVDIAAGSGGFLVVWQRRAYTSSDISGAVVTPAGEVANPEDIPISADGYQQWNPAVASQDGTYLVVWEHIATADPGASALADIRGSRVDATGAVLDPNGMPISTAPGDQQYPNVSANGPFLVTWTDRRRSAGAGDHTQQDVYAARVEPDGTLRPEVVISATDEVESGSVAAPAAGDGTFAVAYERFLPEEPYGTTRAFIRRVSPK